MIYIVGSGSLLFILLCVSPYGSGPIASLSRVFYVHIPNFCSSIANRLLGPQGSDRIKYYTLYIFTEPNPFFQLVYLALSLGGYSIYYTYGFPYIPNPYVPEFHMYVGSVLYFIALMTFVAASIVSPGVVTKQNLSDHINLFKYDGLLYKPADCSTCKIQKPARSKHCKVCGVCVCKQDHHCIWINQCVGYSNYKYFLAFILSHSLICLYAAQVGSMILMFIINKEKLMTAVFTDSQGRQIPSGWVIVFQYILQRYPAFVFVLALCLMMGVVLGGFFIYHFYMVAKNTTSNERIKVMNIEAAENRENIYNHGFWNNVNEVLDAAEF